MRLSISNTLCLIAVAIFALSSCRNEDNKIPETCFDEVRNQGELRVDCGGPNCPECVPDCTDQIENQDEGSTVPNINVAGIDCGGESCEPCASCEDGIQNAHWVRDPTLTEEQLISPNVGQDLQGNLYRLIMEPAIDCGFPCDVCPTDCNNGIQDGTEEGVDCGGSCGNICPDAVPTCNDGIQNGTETGVDCGDLATGGIACGDCPEPTCNDGIQNIHIEYTDIVEIGYLVVVETGIDCDDSPLTSCPDCPTATCFDGIQNGTEEGIDCGGGCGNLCDPAPACNNGFQDGTETGIDCDDDDETPCPPCATCDDDIKNGPEFGVDCLDYPIPEYPCDSICASCHDNIQTVQLNELDVDCGGDCEDCPQFLSIGSIGVGTGGAPFLDQYSFNLQLAGIGNTDTLELDHNLYPGLRIEKIQDNFFPYLEIEAHQGFDTDNGLYIRRVLIQMPYPETIGEGNTRNFLVSNYSEPGPGTGGENCGPFGIPNNDTDYPVIFYSEFLVGGTSNFERCFYLQNTNEATLTINYLFGTPLAGDYLSKGTIDGGGLLYNEGPPEFEEIEGSFQGLEFEVQYDLF